MTAPIAEAEDDWGNFSDFSTDIPSCDIITCTPVKDPNFPDNGITFENCTVSNSSENYGSMEDLVKKFEKKVLSCFKKTKPINSDQPKNSAKSLQSLNDILADNDLWKKITDNYGLVQPLDWSSSQVRKLHLPALELRSKDKSEKQDPDIHFEFDDRELRKQMDFHKLIEYNVYTEYDSYANTPEDDFKVVQDEKVQTADEVIQELEELMLDADEQDAAFDNELEQQTGIVIADNDGSIGEFSLENDLMSDESSVYHGRNLGSPSSQEESDRATCLKQMSIPELEEELSGLESTVKYLSEDLLNQLNLRDELQYEKEIRNTFISKILEVQYKQEQFQQNDKAHTSRFKFGKLSKSFSTSNASVSNTPGRFLTTVIPFDEGGIPSLEGLQALIKLLDAIKADSEEVPSLITNYILKVLCPPPLSSRTLTL